MLRHDDDDDKRCRLDPSPPNHHCLKTCERLEVKLHAFTLAIDGSEPSASRSSRVTSKDTDPLCTGEDVSWVLQQIRMWCRRQHFCPCRESILGFPAHAVYSTNLSD